MQYDDTWSASTIARIEGITVALAKQVKTGEITLEDAKQVNVIDDKESEDAAS